MDSLTRVVEIKSIDEIGITGSFEVRKEEIEDILRGFLVSSVFVDGKIYKSGDLFVFSGKAKALAKLECVRCLADIKIDLEEDVKTFYSHLVKLDEQDSFGLLENKDADFEIVLEDRIDIMNAIRDQLLLMIPYAPVCDEDCKGLCMVCGNDLNKQVCRCKIDKDNENPFAKLAERFR